MNDPTRADILQELGRLADRQAEIPAHGLLFGLLLGEELSSEAPEGADPLVRGVRRAHPFTEDLLERLRRSRDELTAAPEVEQERETLALELERLRAHRRFWSRRGGDATRRVS